MSDEILFFKSGSCPTCPGEKNRLYALLDREKINIPVRELNIDNVEDAKIAAQYCIHSLPAIVYLKDGNPFHTCLGTGAAEKLINEGINGK